MSAANPVYLSVVLSSYNDEKYIAEAIQSILDQTYPYFEFIIVNDGSTDRTLEIIQSFNDPRIVLINKQNTGLIDSLNIGVRAAKYDWIARMDGDDVAEPNRFEEEVKHIHDDVAVISSQCKIINAEGQKMGRTKFPTFECGIRIQISIAFNQPIVHPSAVFNKRIWEIAGGYDPMMYKNEDADLWMKMSAFGKPVVISTPLLRLRKHGANISATAGEEQRLNVWVRVAKGIFGLPRCLSAVEHHGMLRIIKTIPWAQKDVRGNALKVLAFALCRYYIIRSNSELRSYCRSISI